MYSMVFMFMAWSWWIGVIYFTLHMLWTNTEFCTVWSLLLFSTPKGQHTLGMGTWFDWPRCCHCCDYSTHTWPQYILCYGCELKSHHMCVTLRFSLQTKWGQEFVSRNLLLAMYVVKSHFFLNLKQNNTLVFTCLHIILN